MSESKESAVQTEEQKPHRFLKDTWEIVKVLIISLAIVLPIRYFIVQPFIVRGQSMEPNFHERDYLIIDEFSYYFRQPERGEVVVFRYPRDPSQFFIKRIVGLPGEKVEIQNGRIKIINKEFPNGFVLQESYLSPPNHPSHPDELISLTPTHYFVMGDNRDASSDSREWGPLDRGFMVGRVVLRAWPLEKFGTFSPVPTTPSP